MSDINISWDGRTDRPKILESFRTTQGRVAQNASGILTVSPVPAFTDIAFFNFTSAGTAATKGNYANNTFFPRADPQRCTGTAPPGGFPTVESTGLTSTLGDWNISPPGTRPHTANASRLHSDGDVYAGAATGSGGLLPGGTGPGVACPGSMGFRVVDVRNYQYANLVRWLTQDRVHQVQWGGAADRDQHRRGFATVGNVTDPTIVPTTGTSLYPVGYLWGQYSATGASGPEEIIADISVSVNHATRAVTIAVTNMRILSSGAPVPLNFSTTPALGASGTANTNYFTTAISTGTGLTGGLSGRLFGPVAGGGAPEIGGAFRLSGGSSPAAVVGGFIARRNP